MLQENLIMLFLIGILRRVASFVSKSTFICQRGKKYSWINSTGPSKDLVEKLDDGYVWSGLWNCPSESLSFLDKSFFGWANFISWGKPVVRGKSRSIKERSATRLKSPWSRCCIRNTGTNWKRRCWCDFRFLLSDLSAYSCLDYAPCIPDWIGTNVSFQTELCGVSMSAKLQEHHEYLLLWKMGGLLERRTHGPSWERKVICSGSINAQCEQPAGNQVKSGWEYLPENQWLKLTKKDAYKNPMVVVMNDCFLVAF